MVIGVFVRLMTFHWRGLPGYHHCPPLAIPNSTPISVSYGCVGITSTSLIDAGSTLDCRRPPTRLHPPLGLRRFFQSLRFVHCRRYHGAKAVPRCHLCSKCRGEGLLISPRCRFSARCLSFRLRRASSHRFRRYRRQFWSWVYASSFLKIKYASIMSYERSSQDQPMR